jgi:poly(A) polymerase
MKHDVRGNLTPTDAARLVGVARKSLKLSNDVLDAMADITRWTHLVLNTREPGVALLKRFLARPNAKEARQLLDALAATGVATDRMASLQSSLDALAKTDFAPPPLLTGDDLVAAGFQPGPAFKKVLEEVYDAQLELRIGSKDEAIAMARNALSQ